MMVEGMAMEFERFIVESDSYGTTEQAGADEALLHYRMNRIEDNHQCRRTEESLNVQQSRYGE